jgi:hypothetical protein
MNLFRKISFCLVIIFPWGMDLFANSGASSNNPYAQIVTRNVFALDPSVSSASSTPTKLLPTITPNGIMTVFGSVQTLFKVTDSQFGQPASERSYILGEGQREDDIKVVRIDEKNAVVTFNNHGMIQELPLVAATASGNVGQIASSNPNSLHGNRFAGGRALASANQISGNNGNITDSPRFSSGYAGGAYKNDTSGQGLMVPNVSFAGTSDSDNASLQAPAVSNDVGSDNNSVSGQGTDISAAEHLADIQMVLFARQHMQ